MSCVYGEKGWDQERAAGELGVSLRTYKDYENSDCIKRFIALATLTLTTENQLNTMSLRKQQPGLLSVLRRMHHTFRREHPAGATPLMRIPANKETGQ